jgi:hypothetical protein
VLPVGGLTVGGGLWKGFAALHSYNLQRYAGKAHYPGRLRQRDRDPA